MIIDNFAGAYLGVKLVNGKIRPKYGVSAILGIIFMIAISIGCIVGFIYGLINANIEFIVVFAIGLASIIYIWLINPYTQNSNNYYIEYQNENSLEGFKLTYKGKQVNIKHKIGRDGKIAFANNISKLSCVSYADGTQMSNFTKYRIINYFAKWLISNNLLSSEVTLTFEEL